MYRSDSYKCTLQRLKYLCSRDRPALFPFDDFNCHEKSFKTYQPKTINYRLYKTFRSKEIFINNDGGFQRFCRISLDALNKHAPRKKKHARGNQMPFFNKELSKAIIARTKLQNILRKKFVVDIKLFWKIAKPLLSDQVAGKDKIHLIENNEFVKANLETAEVLNNFFSKIAQTLDISRYSNDESLVSNTNDSTLKVNLKYRNHPSIITIQNNSKDKVSFNFIEVDPKQIEKEILMLQLCS